MHQLSAFFIYQNSYADTSVWQKCHLDLKPTKRFAVCVLWWRNLRLSIKDTKRSVNIVQRMEDRVLDIRCLHWKRQNIGRGPQRLLCPQSIANGLQDSSRINSVKRGTDMLYTTSISCRICFHSTHSFFGWDKPQLSPFRSGSEISASLVRWTKRLLFHWLVTAHKQVKGQSSSGHCPNSSDSDIHQNTIPLKDLTRLFKPAVDHQVYTSRVELSWSDTKWNLSSLCLFTERLWGYWHTGASKGQTQAH